MSLIRLLDISGLFWPIWRAKEAAGRPIGEAATETVQLLRRYASAGDVDHVVACCDSGRSFRHEIALEYRAIDPDYKGYKANRKERDAAMMAALDRVIDNLEQDGVPIFRAPGFEADDVIATLVTWAVPKGHDVEVVSDDKDLASLVSPAMTLTGDNGPVQFGGVQVVKRSGEVIGPAEVKERFGVEPHQIPEWLAMVGDVSDHVKGVPGIGEGKASAMLSAYGTWRAIVEAAKKDAEYVAECECKLALAREQKIRPLPTFDKPRFQNATRAAILANQALFDISLRLTTLRTDVPLDFAKVTAPRVPKRDPEKDAERDALLARAAEEAAEEDRALVEAAKEALSQQEEQIMSTSQTITDAEFTDAPADRPSEPKAPAPPAAPAQIAPAQVAAQPAQNTNATKASASTATQGQSNAIVKVAERPFEQQLEARNLTEAQWLAKSIAASRKIKDAGDENAVLLKLTVGRSLGMTLYQCLRMYLMEGQVTMRTQQVLARVKSSPLCEYIRKKQGDDKTCTWVTKRRGEPEQSYTFTIEKARRAMLGGIKAPGQDFDPQSAWAKWPEDMLSARACMPLMRQEYPELVDGYSMEELGDDPRAHNVIDAVGEAA